MYSMKGDEIKQKTSTNKLTKEKETKLLTEV